jgi:hypothetical protein
MIWAKLQKYIGIFVAALAAAAAIFVKGRTAGKKVEKAKQAQADAKAQERRNETIKESANVAHDVASMSGSDVEQRLRDKYTRD